MSMTKKRLVQLQMVSLTIAAAVIVVLDDEYLACNFSPRMLLLVNVALVTSVNRVMTLPWESLMIHLLEFARNSPKRLQEILQYMGIANSRLLTHTRSGPEFEHVLRIYL